MHNKEWTRKKLKPFQVFTSFDQERLEKAKEKHERKAVKRLSDTQLS